MSSKRGWLVTIGSFDGVHVGHQTLLARTVAEAKKRKLKSMALTFVLPPRMILDPNSPHRILSDAAEKEALLRACGVDNVVFMDFDKKVATIKAFSFFRSVLLNELNAKGVVIGTDFRFGVGRSAGALELVRWGEEFEIPVWVISPVKHQRKVASSSLIRHLLETGHFKQAVGFLGHPYLIEGRVVPGWHAGRKLGFPTANLRPAAGKILPRGVYVIRGSVLGAKSIRFTGVCNIGTRPTLVGKSAVTVEAHLFGHQPSLVGKTIRLELLHRLRSEKKFKSAEHLKRAIAADVAQAKRFLSRNNALN